MNDQSAVLTSLTDVTPVLEGVSATGLVSGLLFELSVEQRYRNPGTSNIEAVYMFPLPWGATLLSLEFEIGGKRLQGVVVERKAAQKRYEEALDEGNTAVLLERSAEGLYTVNVGNLLAGETAVVRYRYAQLLDFVKGQVRLSVPTVIAPSYGSAIADAGLEAQQAPSTHLLAEYPFSIEVAIEGPLANGVVTSPTHKIGLGRTENGIRATLAGKNFLDRNFVLSIHEIETLATATVARDEDGYVVHAAFCPTISAGDARPARTLKILVDCSGSMAGSSIAAAKRALHDILSRLEPQDRFSLARFGDTYQPIQKHLVPASDAAIGIAGKAVSGVIEADLGGTQMGEALEAILKQDAGERADVLLITDGQVWKADAVVAKAKDAGHRIFVVGIGAAPAGSLLERLAAETGGATEYVAAGEDATRAITRMFHRTGQPPAKAVHFQFPGNVTWQTQAPAAIYDGETIHVFAGLAAKPAGEAMLEYLMPDGSIGRQAVVLANLPEPGAIPRIAASHRLPMLGEGERAAFAVRYGLVTDRTSLVLVYARAEGEKVAELPSTVVVPQMMAAGWGGTGMNAMQMAIEEDISTFRDLSKSYYKDREVSSMRARRDSPEPRIQKDRRGLPARLRDALFGIGSSSTPRQLMDILGQDELMGEAFAGNGLPRTINDLAKLGVSSNVIQILREIIRRGYSERVVVKAFLELVAAFSEWSGSDPAIASKIAALFDAPDDGHDARELVRLAFTGTTANAWRIQYPR